MANKVPQGESQAGPGCWQCADCGRIQSDETDECDCTDPSHLQLTFES